MADHPPVTDRNESTPFLAASDGVYISVRVQPRSSKNQVEGQANGSLKVKLNSPPVDGAANAALIDLLSKLLKIRKSAINIVSGEKSRNKRVFVQGVGLARVKEALSG